MKYAGKIMFFLLVIASVMVLAFMPLSQVSAKPLTKEEAVKYGKEIAAELQENMAETLVKQMLIPCLTEKKAKIHENLLAFANSHPEVAQKHSSFQIKGMVNQLVSMMPQLADQLTTQIAPVLEDFAPRYSGISSHQGKQWIIIRNECSEDIVYFMIYCEKDTNGEICIKDFINPSTGETPIDTVIHTMTENIKTAWAQEAGIVYESKVKYLQQIAMASAYGQMALVIDIYESHFQEDASFNIAAAASYLNALIANSSEDISAEEQKKIDAHAARVRRLAPDYVGIEMLLIDHNIQCARFEEALASIEKTRRIIGEDAYLDVLEGLIYMSSEEDEKAAAAFKMAKKKDLQYPMFLELYRLHSMAYPELYQD